MLFSKATSVDVPLSVRRPLRTLSTTLLGVIAFAIVVWLVGSQNPYTPAGYVGYLTKGAVFGQARFDGFVREFNDERPHEALGMKMPHEMYSPSPRRYVGLPELSYPLHDRDVLVTACGRICMHRKRINLSHVLAGQRVGIKEVDEGIWIVSFMHYDLGYIDLEQKTLQPLDNPFGTRVSPMS